MSSLSPTTKAADQRNDATLIANTVVGLATANSRAANAGPAKNPTLSIVLEATFAAVSSPGSRASAGSTAACAGRNTVPATALRVART